MLANTDQVLLQVFNMARQNDLLAFDFETTSTESHTTSIVGFSLSDGLETYYVPCRHLLAHENAPETWWRSILSELEDRKVTLIAHNAKFEIRVARREGFILNIVHDTLLMAFCVGTFLELGLKPLVKQLFRHEMTEYKDLFGAKDKSKRFDSLPVSVAEAYAGDDALWTYKLYQRLSGMLTDATAKISRLEHGILAPVMRMEDIGLPVDSDYQRHEGKRLLEVANKVEQIWYLQVAQRLNIPANQAKVLYPINSSQKLVQLLYENPKGLNLKVLKRTKPGKTATGGNKPSTDESALKSYREHDPIIANLLTWRELGSASRSYLKIAGMVYPDGRLRADLNQTGAGTGRFGSSNPNVQNWANPNKWDIFIPVKQPDNTFAFASNWKIETVFRRSLRAPEGFTLFEFDFSQIEYRIMAGFIKSPRLLGFYEQGEDMHIATYSFCFRVPKSAVTKAMRRVGKTINFALVYGMGVDHFYRELKGLYTREQVAQIHARYFEMLPELVQFHNDTRAHTDRFHTVDTYFGRHQLIPEYLSDNAYERSKARRAGVSRIIQGSAADVMKLAILKSWRLITTNPIYSAVQMVLTIHDALMFIVPNHIDLNIFADDLRAVVEMQLPGFPRFTIDFKAGQTWGDAEEGHFGTTNDNLNGLQQQTGPEAVSVIFPADATPGQLRDFGQLLTGEGPLAVELKFNGISRVKQTTIAYSVIEARAKSIPGVIIS